MDTLRRNIAQLMGHRSINQVGVESGVGQSWLQRFMNPDKADGIATAKPDKVAKLAEYFAVPAADLQHRDLSSPAPSQPAGLDVGRLADLLGTVEAAVEKAGVRLSARVRARLVATLYADREASAAASAQAVQAALVGILATMEATDEPDAAR